MEDPKRNNLPSSKNKKTSYISGNEISQHQD